MIVWILQAGEPLHFDDVNPRPMRAMNLANVLVGANKAKILDAFKNNSIFSNANTALDLYCGSHASERIVTELLNGS